MTSGYLFMVLCRFLFIYLFGVLRRFQHCTGHITTGSWKGRGNQYIQFIRVLYCKLPTNSKQLPAFPLEAVTGIEPRPQRWEARMLLYVAFNTVQVISRRIVGRAEETSTYSWSRFCTVNCRPTSSNYQLSHLRPCREPNPGLRGGRRECYHSATVAPATSLVWNHNILYLYTSIRHHRSLKEIQLLQIIFTLNVTYNRSPLVI